MLKKLTEERNAALLLLASALAGLLVANTGLGESFVTFARTPLELKDFGLALSPTNFAGEFLMTGFFLLIGLELKREFSEGVFQNRKAIWIPALAALFGAIIPALIYLAFTAGDPGANRGWGIPMATDLTFALAVLSVFGKRFPAQGRSFVLTFAVIDDLIAIIVIAIFVTTAVNLLWLGVSLAVLGLFWLAQKQQKTLVMPFFALIAWYSLYESGVQPAVVGVLLGLMIARDRVDKLESAFTPWVSVLVLPLFAFFTTAVNLGNAFSLITPVFIAILLRPIGKILGILFGVWLGKKVAPSSEFKALSSRDFLALSTLGGIGFSVALLIANSTFGVGYALANQAIIATLLATVVSGLVAALALSNRKN